MVKPTDPPPAGTPASTPASLVRTQAEGLLALAARLEGPMAAPFAAMTLASINSADPTHPTVKPVPYTGVQFVAIPEFQGLGDTVGKLFSAHIPLQWVLYGLTLPYFAVIGTSILLGRLYVKNYSQPEAAGSPTLTPAPAAE